MPHDWVVVVIDLPFRTEDGAGFWRHWSSRRYREHERQGTWRSHFSLCCLQGRQLRVRLVLVCFFDEAGATDDGRLNVVEGPLTAGAGGGGCADRLLLYSRIESRSAYHESTPIFASRYRTDGARIPVAQTSTVASPSCQSKNQGGKVFHMFHHSLCLGCIKSAPVQKRGPVSAPKCLRENSGRVKRVYRLSFVNGRFPILASSSLPCGAL